MGLVESPVHTKSEGTFQVKTIASRGKITASADAAGLLSHAGGLLLLQTLRVTGLDTALSAGLQRWRSSRAVHDPGKIVADLALSLALGHWAQKAGAHPANAQRRLAAAGGAPALVAPASPSGRGAPAAAWRSARLSEGRLAPRVSCARWAAGPVLMEFSGGFCGTLS
jgi:hypothetical protein